jgi:hypothetical protein
VQVLTMAVQAVLKAANVPTPAAGSVEHPKVGAWTTVSTNTLLITSPFEHYTA